MTTAADLPIELHAEILQNLHHYQDRPTLIATALVCKDWCTSSQRILFRAVTDHWHDNSDRKESVILTHMLFLESIAEHPRRLGPLVHCYVQHHMACNRAATRMRGIPKSNYEVWELTEMALPAMTNLKHLYVNPAADITPAIDNWVSSRMLLKSFTFQLETLSWRSCFSPQNGVPEFIATQNNLIHLDIGRDPFWMDLSWLTDGVCPHLISVAGGFNSLNHVARSRKIIAWKWYPHSNDTELVSYSTPALDALKYLSVYSYKFFRDIIGSINLKINLLELMGGAWDIGTIASFANLPNLQVLVLIQHTYTTITDQDIMQSAFDCFERLPRLECIILAYSHLHGKEYQYLKLSLHPGSTEHIFMQRLNICYDVGPLWWTIYGI